MEVSVLPAGEAGRSRTVPNESYVYGIDLLRFFAATLVAFFHLTWLEASTARLDWFGWIGVEIFFVISGFVIAQSAQGATPLNFVISRFLRIYPAAWICGVISFVMLLAGHAKVACFLPLLGHFLRSLVLYPEGPFLATAYWTLPIEITFYGLIAAVLYLRGFRHIELIALVLCVCSAIYVVALGIQDLRFFTAPWLDFGYSWKNLTLLRHGIYFAGGIFLWLRSEHRLSLLGYLGLGLVLFVAPVEIICRTAELVKLSPAAMNVASVGWVPVLIWLLSVAFIAAAAHWRAECQFLPRRLLAVVRLLGLTTYPFYLMHEVIGHAVRYVFLAFGLSILVSAVAGVLAAASVALLIAAQGEPRFRRKLKAWIESVRQREKRLA